MGTPTWFVSHTHLDHIAALPVYVARRRMMKMEPPTIYLPEHAVELVEHLLKVCQRLDRGRLPCELIGVRPGDEFELSRELVVQAVATRHTVPSLGYVVWERRKKLKAEYQGLTGDQIRDMRLSGVEVAEERRMPLVAYTGDTSPEGLDANPAMYEAKVLITEMSFVAPGHRKEKIHKHGHMHLDDFVERQRPLPERADHRRPLQHPLSRQAGRALRAEGAARHARRAAALVALTGARLRLRCIGPAEKMEMTSGDIRTDRLQMPTGSPMTQQQLPMLTIARTEPATAMPQLLQLHHLHAADDDEQVEHREAALDRRWPPGPTVPCWIWRTHFGSVRVDVGFAKRHREIEHRDGQAQGRRRRSGPCRPPATRGRAPVRAGRLRIAGRRSG